MPDTGFIRPSEVFTDDFGNAENTLTAGNGGTTNTTSGVGDVVELGNFTFGVPSGATINGIQFIYRVQNTNENDDITVEAKLRIGEGNYGSIDSIGVSETSTRTFGGPTNLLGLSPTSANINDLRYHIEITDNPEPDNLRIINTGPGFSGDFTAVKVYYTEASPAGTNTLNITSGKLTISLGRLTL